MRRDAERWLSNGPPRHVVAGRHRDGIDRSLDGRDDALEVSAGDARRDDETLSGVVAADLIRPHALRHVGELRERDPGPAGRSDQGAAQGLDVLTRFRWVA